MLFYLIMGHFVCDFALQTQYMAEHKNPLKAPGYWFWVMAGHCSTHAVAVAVITQSIWLGALEFFAHFILDWLKCYATDDHETFAIDQLGHLACKFFWCFLASILPHARA